MWAVEGEHLWLATLYLIEKGTSALRSQKTSLDEPMTDPLADWMERDSKREIDVAEGALFPSVRMQHKAKPSLDKWLSRYHHSL